MDAKKFDKSVDNLPGAAPDVADRERETEKAVRADVKNLNNNPRNTDTEMP